MFGRDGSDGVAVLERNKSVFGVGVGLESGFFFETFEKRETSARKNTTHVAIDLLEMLRKRAPQRM